MISNRIVQKNQGGVTSKLWGWGDSSSLGLIQYTVTTPFSQPTQTSWLGAGDGIWKKVSNGGGFVCAIDGNDKLWCWGVNTYGQLGDGTTNSTSSPVLVGASSWSDVYCGTNHVLARNSNGKLYTWGRNNHGQLGDNTTTNKSSPILINGTINKWTKLSAGHEFSAGIAYFNGNGGYLYTWGRNNRGQIGNGSTIDRLTPSTVSYAGAPLYIWSDVSAGYEHCIASANNYYVNNFFGWGRNNRGQLGIGNTADQTSPFKASFNLPSITSRMEACGHSSAIISNSVIYSFGDNTYGQLGIGSMSTYFNNPQTVTSIVDVPTYIQMIANNSPIKMSTFVKTGDIYGGKIYSAGLNAGGELGDGTTTDRNYFGYLYGNPTNWSILSQTSGGIYTGSMFAIKV